MCGRTSLFVPPDVLEQRFDADVPDEYVPRYNIAPGADLEVITNETTDSIQQYRWGLLPEWLDGEATGYSNARSESAGERRAFSDAWEARPCLVPSTGFYEWAGPEGAKRAYRIHRRDDPVFAMAGLWKRRETPEHSLETVTILTTEANDTVAPIHDRMPVVLEPRGESAWLKRGPREREELCRPYSGGDLAAYEISRAVNDPRNDTSAVIEPLGHEQSGLGEFGS